LPCSSAPTGTSAAGVFGRLRLLQRRRAVFQRRNLGLELVSQLDVLLAHRHADFFRQGIAALLRGLVRGNCSLSRIIEPHRLGRQRFRATVFQPLIEQGGVLADPADVMHVGGSCFDAAQAG
jgi:hypothetical protein